MTEDHTRNLQAAMRAHAEATERFHAANFALKGAYQPTDEQALEFKVSQEVMAETRRELLRVFFKCAGVSVEEFCTVLAGRPRASAVHPRLLDAVAAADKRVGVSR